jgi:hypothetical protein
MNTIRQCQAITGALLLLFISSYSPAAVVSIGEQKFDLFETKTATYTNVTVTTKAETYVFIQHSGGITSLKLGEIPAELRVKMGYSLTPETKVKPGKKQSPIITAAAREIQHANQNLKPLGQMLGQRFSQHPVPKITPSQLLVALGIVLVVYFGFCYCCHLICLKAKSPTSALVWVPMLQFIPLLRAAGMSGWWFLGMFVPFLNWVVQIMWSFKIVKAREKNVVWAILLILPLTNILAFLYLAFSSSAPPEAAPAPKFQARGLQVA